MRVLVTGSRGFIGRYFVSNYRDDYEISTFSFQMDSFQDLSFDDVDKVIHLSALVHQMGGASFEEYIKVNVGSTISLAQKAKENGVKQFVFMSTVKVYGEETNSVYTEETTCIPEDEYGKSKLKAEQELLNLEDETFKVSIIRTPIVYGYGVKANIKNLILLVDKVRLLPFGDINNRRSMVYIGNLCYLIDCICKKNQRGIFLASDDKAISTKRFIQLIAKSLDKKIYLIKVPFFSSLLKKLKPSFHSRLYGSLELDNKITRKILNLKMPYSVEEGIFKTVNGEKN